MYVCLLQTYGFQVLPYAPSRLHTVTTASRLAPRLPRSGRTAVLGLKAASSVESEEMTDTAGAYIRRISSSVCLRKRFTLVKTDAKNFAYTDVTSETTHATFDQLACFPANGMLS